MVDKAALEAAIEGALANLRAARLAREAAADAEAALWQFRPAPHVWAPGELDAHYATQAAEQAVRDALAALAGAEADKIAPYRRREAVEFDLKLRCAFGLAKPPHGPNAPVWARRWWAGGPVFL